MRGLPDQKRMVVAGVEIAGGLYGLAASMPQLVNAKEWLHRIPYALAATFFFATFVAGMLLWQKRRIGITWSIRLLLPQLLWVKSSLVTVVLYSGARAGIALPLAVNANFGSGFEFGSGYRPEGGSIGLNILALYCLLLLVEQREILDAPPPVDRVAASNSNELPE
jgi:hypothetical protein